MHTHRTVVDLAPVDIGFGNDYLGCHEVELRHNVVLWGRYKPVGNVVLNTVNQWLVRPRTARSMLQSLHATTDNTTWEWRWNCCGFDFGRASDPSNRTLGGVQVSLWVIPYWSIVIPLTLFSVYLLLSKPRQSTPKKLIEPVTNEGT